MDVSWVFFGSRWSDLSQLSAGEEMEGKVSRRRQEEGRGHQGEAEDGAGHQSGGGGHHGHDRSHHRSGHGREGHGTGRKKSRKEEEGKESKKKRGGEEEERKKGRKGILKKGEHICHCGHLLHDVARLCQCPSLRFQVVARPRPRTRIWVDATGIPSRSRTGEENETIRCQPTHSLNFFLTAGGNSGPFPP